MFGYNNLGSFQEVTVSDFFQWNQPEIFLQHQDGIQKEPREKLCLQEMIVTIGNLG